MTPPRIYYLTTPIYYVNDSPHIGHAYTSLACDVLARFMRLDGRRVHFLTGTDEHGQKVEKAAAAAGRVPQEFVDEVSVRFRGLSRVMNLSNDDFIRTTEPRHLRACQALWRAIAGNRSPKGRENIYLGKYAGWYSVRDEAFYAESELQTAPAGAKRGPSGAPVEWVEEPSYFFRLSDWRDWLLAYYQENPNFIGPDSRRNEVISFVKGGLQDLSISRTSFKWGIPVPNDPAHIMYVWLDALTNYITAAGYPETDNSLYRACWPADLHMVGKDIVRFHAVYWPAFLAAAGVAVPQRVFAHGWWTNEGQKISKSLGNVIDPTSLVTRYGLDQVRYFLLREVPFGNDGDFSHSAMVRRINNDLANDLGNLAQRVLSMIHKNCGAAVPSAEGIDRDGDAITLDALNGAQTLIVILREKLARQAFHEALEAIWEVVRRANLGVDKSAPWALRKSAPARMAAVLYVHAELLRHLALLLSPFMPESCARLLDQLAVPAERRGFADLSAPGALTEGASALKPGTPLPPPTGLFPRFNEATAQA